MFRYTDFHCQKLLFKISIECVVNKSVNESTVIKFIGGIFCSVHMGGAFVCKYLAVIHASKILVCEYRPLPQANHG